jgi:MoxR-like ATPase
MPTLPDDLQNESGKPSAKKIVLDRSRELGFQQPEEYRAGPELADAIRVALLLRKPLLVTGEPGTGKTELGRYIAWKCQWRALQFDAKSDSGWRDLYYVYDALGRFQVQQTGVQTDPRDYFRLSALGEAILRSNTTIRNDVLKILPHDFLHKPEEQCVVIIDEIDKASRDFPNDLLNELDQDFFRIPELNVGRIEANKDFKPVLVITSNSEKALPAAFLRRCIYFHIEFPRDPVKLREWMNSIVCARLKEFRENPKSPLLEQALDLFLVLRNAGLNKAPATAELLDWMLALVESKADLGKGLKEQRELIVPTLTTAVKHEADRPLAQDAANRWAGTS